MSGKIQERTSAITTSQSLQALFGCSASIKETFESKHIKTLWKIAPNNRHVLNSSSVESFSSEGDNLTTTQQLMLLLFSVLPQAFHPKWLFSRLSLQPGIRRVACKLQDPISVVNQRWENLYWPFSNKYMFVLVSSITNATLMVCKSVLTKVSIL